MLEKVENYLILKNPITLEEHIGKILNVEKDSRKIKLQLVDEKNTRYYKNNKEVEILIPYEEKLYHFKTVIIYFDIIEKILTIEYPEKIDDEIIRKYKRYDINLALDIFLKNHIVPSISYDISLGGIAFIINDNIEMAEILSLKIKTEDLEEFIFKVRVIHVKNIRYKKQDFLLYSAEFCNPSEEEFETLFVFFTKIEEKKAFDLLH